MDIPVTVTRQDFKPAYQNAAITIPTQPPLRTGSRIFMPSSKSEDCTCAVRDFKSNKHRYERVEGEVSESRDDAADVDLEMRNLTENDWASGDEAMKSVYRTDFRKRELIPIRQYRRLVATVDSPMETTLGPVLTELRNNGYRDPTTFKYNATDRPIIQPAKDVHFVTVPEAFVMWSERFTGRSEYMDTISKMGLSNMKNRQQYLEPSPSSRRRQGDDAL